MTPGETSRLMQRYAKAYHAGAFAMPTAKELAARGWEQNADGSVVWTSRTLTRPSNRTDWTGRKVELPTGARLADAVARDVDRPDGPVPNFGAYDFVRTYREDVRLRDALAGQGRQIFATTMSAASEIHALWGPRGMAPLPAFPVDDVTVGAIEFPDVGDGIWAEAAYEVTGLTGWHDDYPYYSDGSWSSLSLRGFDPDDPTWGVKPAEMGAKWNAAHPGAIDRKCGWTRLAEDCPALMTIVDSGPWTDLERVRVLRMAGTTKPKPHHLKRHTDITDKAGGPRFGHIVRFHLPVVTDPAITLSAWTLDGDRHDVHLTARACWYLDARKPHAVTNPTATDRIHLTVDAVMDERLMDLIETSRRAVCG